MPKQLTMGEWNLFRDLVCQSEGCTVTDQDGVWKTVFLDSIDLRAANPQRFAGLLASLTEKGLYRPQDGEAFGEVNIADPQ